MNNTGGIQLRLGDLIYGVLKRWKMILVLTFVGLIFGIMIAAFSYIQGTYSNYQVEASFVILTKSDQETFTAYGTPYPHPADYDFAAEMVDSVNYVIKSDLTMNKAIDSLKIIGIKPKDISQNLTLSVLGSTAIVEATLTWRNAEEGIDILNAVLDAAQVTMKDTLKVGELSVITKPAAKQSITGTLGGSVWGYMTILGFIAGVGYVMLELIMRPTLTNLSDMEGYLGLESLGVIPQDKKYFKNKKSLLVEDEVTSPAVEQNYASTAFILRNRLSVATAPHSFYVTSTISGEGRSMVAANLAVQLSDMENKVLLIDMDSRNPTLGKLFLNHVDYDRSLNALYRGDATVEESIYTLTGYLDLLPMVIDRQPIPMEGAVFDLIKSLEKKYEYVIIDTSPVGRYSDVLSLNAIVETVLFVVGYDSATLPEIQSAVDKLDKSGIRILGAVVNGVQNLTGMTRKEEDDDRVIQIRKSNKQEPLPWEQPGSGAPTDLSSIKAGKKKKKRKKGLFKKKRYKHDLKDKDTDEFMDEITNDVTEGAELRESRKDALTELMEEEHSSEKKIISDNDASDALFRIGMEGSFDEESDHDAESEDDIIDELTGVSFRQAENEGKEKREESTDSIEFSETLISDDDSAVEKEILEKAENSANHGNSDDGEITVDPDPTEKDEI